MTTHSTTGQRTADLVAHLTQRLAALGDGRDARSVNEQETYRLSYDAIQRTISALRNPHVDKPNRLIRENEAERADVLALQADVEQRLADAPDPESITDKRERAREVERQHGLRGSLDLIRNRVRAIDERIAQWTERRAQAEQTDEMWIKQAEQLLGETVTS
jgi:hypothetical protein